ncbi:hypothetical protein F2Q68_00018429 [Brassica cretica]|uniref:non-specific serine/threonine protein kinase n=1 Tax=Brassica cretica TaxID=69181 RepID=A0A8S9HGV5_BRACR|nr:hypothetical protein F2Q68_00018429 [Brassica cretica]
MRPTTMKPGHMHTNKHADEAEQLEETTLKTFTFRELATATKNFRQECLLGEGGFGRVYKGTLQPTGQVVAVKQLDKHGLHGNKEFQAEVLSLGRLDHPNLVKLPKSDREPMDWTTRMQIAYGAAQGLDYLHDKVNPPVIYRDLKASNVLLDDDLCPKLSDFGLHKLGPGTGDKMVALTSRVMGTYGYSAPEYTRGGNLTLKSDVYSFGVVLLELITDPVLENKFSERGLNQAVAIASMCVQEEATTRPLISDVMVALSFLSMSKEDGVPTTVPILSFRDKSMSIALSRHDSDLASSKLAVEDEKSSTSSDKESSVDSMKERVIKREEEDSSSESDDGSGSNSDEEHEEDRNSLSTEPIDEKNQTQSLKINYRYSWEEVDVSDEKLSSKGSQKSNDESIYSCYDIEVDHDDLPRNEKHIHLEHIHSSKSEDDQSVYFDDESGDDNEISFHRIKSEVDVDYVEDDSETSLHPVK